MFWIIPALLLVICGVYGFYQAAENNKLSIGAGLGILVAIILLWLSTGLVQLGVGQVGVITRFGGVTGREVTEGISLKAPAPIESVVKFDTRVQKQEIKSQAASKDLQDVSADLVLNYHIERGKVSSLYKTVGKDYVKIIIEPGIQEVFKATTAKFTSTELIQNREQVKSEAQTALSERFKQYGIVVDSLNLVNFTFSQAFNNSIEAVQVANQRAKEAEAKLNQVKAEADQKVAQAQADAESQRLQAQSITPEYLQLKLIEKWNGAYPSTIAGGNAPLLLQLPQGGK